MENYPLLSVIVPVYNVEKYLNQCIASIVNQTYTNLEIILVNDGSTDNSGKICDSWAERDSRIKVFHKINGGGGEARNLGMDVATGELVGMVDSDDYLHPNMYMHLYSLMDDDVDIVECVLRETEADDCLLDDGSTYQAKKYTVEEAMRLHLQTILFKQTPPNKLYRYSVLKEVRYPVGTLIDDEFWTYRVIGNARNLVHTSACMYAYRRHQGSVMHRPYSVRRLDGPIAIRERIYYIQEKFPDLQDDALYSFLSSCLLAAKMILRGMKGDEQRKTWQRLEEIWEDALLFDFSETVSSKRKLLLWMAKKSLRATAILMLVLEMLNIFES